MLAPVCLLLPFRFLSQKDRGRQKAAGPFEEVKHPETRLFLFFFFLSVFMQSLVFKAGPLKARGRLARSHAGRGTKNRVLETSRRWNSS